MTKSRIIVSVAAAALTAAMAATMAYAASVPSSPAEKAATAALNVKILGDNAAEEARAKARQEAYEVQVKQQQVLYDEQKRTYEQQKAQYEQQLKNAQFNTGKQPAPPPQ